MMIDEKRLVKKIFGVEDLELIKDHRKQRRIRIVGSARDLARGRSLMGVAVH